MFSNIAYNFLSFMFSSLLYLSLTRMSADISRQIYLFCSLLHPKYLELCLAHSRCLVNIYWINKVTELKMLWGQRILGDSDGLQVSPFFCQTLLESYHVSGPELSPGKWSGTDVGPALETLYPEKDTSTIATISSRGVGVIQLHANSTH